MDRTVDFNSARQIAKDFIEAMYGEGAKKLAGYHQVTTERFDVDIIDSATIEKDYGWIFFFNSRTFLQTRDDLYRLVGNVPFVVMKSDGTIHVLGRRFFVVDQIKLFEAVHIAPEHWDPELREEYRLILFSEAVHNDDRPTLNKLLQEGFSASAQYQALGEGMFSAVIHHNPEMITFLVSQGADINYRSSGGKTPLMNAALNQASPRLIWLLLRYGASPRLRDDNGENASDYARGMGFVNYWILKLKLL